MSTQWVASNYFSFDREVRRILKDKMGREQALRVISTQILRLLTTVEPSKVRGGVHISNGGLPVEQRLYYDKLLTDFVSEIIVDELGKQKEKANARRNKS
jgi:hypothetical protein